MDVGIISRYFHLKTKIYAQNISQNTPISLQAPVPHRRCGVLTLYSLLHFFICSVCLAGRDWVENSALGAVFRARTGVSVHRSHNSRQRRFSSLKTPFRTQIAQQIWPRRHSRTNAPRPYNYIKGRCALTENLPLVMWLLPKIIVRTAARVAPYR